jgi:hypothetical protein
MLVAEGEEAQDRDRGNPPRRNLPTYKVVKVEARKVTLKDERGQEFTVSLYDNKSRRPVKTVNQKSIKVNKAAVPQKAARIITSAAGTSGTGTSGSTGKTGAPALTSRQIRKLSVEEKDALVAKGVLKKHNTPFGPVYQRPRK